MSADLRAHCALNISEETLSALRDHLLAPDEAARIHAHAVTCPACHDRLEGFARIGAALTNQQLSGPSASLWDDVQAAIARKDRANMRTRYAWRPPRHVSPLRPATLTGLAAALLIAALFGLVLRGVLVGTSPAGQPTATSARTATPQPPIPVTPPAWQIRHTPNNMMVGLPSASLSIAPSDGTTAYTCGLSTSEIAGSTNVTLLHSHVFVTQDRGANWTPLSDVAVGSRCGPLVVDDLDTRILVVGTGGSMHLSTSGGESWLPFPALQETAEHVTSLTQLNWSGTGTAYAVLDTTPRSDTETGVHLAVSSDGLRTWHDIDAGITLDASLNDQVTQFWRNPVNGNLLVKTIYTFWKSGDGGVTWTHIDPRAKLPGDPRAELAGAFVVQELPNDTGWRICSPFICSDDSGDTWTTLPAIAPSSTQSGFDAFALTTDGALLVRESDVTPNQAHLLRLPAGASRWQDLGLTPTPTASYVDAPAQNGEVLWELPITADGYSQFSTALLPASA